MLDQQGCQFELVQLGMFRCAERPRRLISQTVRQRLRLGCVMRLVAVTCKLVWSRLAAANCLWIRQHQFPFRAHYPLSHNRARRGRSDKASFENRDCRQVTPNGLGIAWRSRSPQSPLSGPRDAQTRPSIGSICPSAAWPPWPPGSRQSPLELAEMPEPAARTSGSVAGPVCNHSHGGFARDGACIKHSKLPRNLMAGSTGPSRLLLWGLGNRWRFRRGITIHRRPARVSVFLFLSVSVS